MEGKADCVWPWVGNALAYRSSIVADDNLERQEVDTLIQELSKVRSAPKVVKPVASTAPVTPVAPAAPPAAPSVSRWTSARLIMPAAPMEPKSNRFTFASRLNLPALPALPSLPDFGWFSLTPGPVAIVRLWVGLGVALGASMAYWPYPRTYFIGLFVYLFAVDVVLLTGVWAAKLSWDARLGGAHTIALGTVLWSITLAVQQTLAAVI